MWDADSVIHLEWIKELTAISGREIRNAIKHPAIRRYKKCNSFRCSLRGEDKGTKFADISTHYGQATMTRMAEISQGRNDVTTPAV